MSRKQDPIVGVLRYFEESDLALAQQGLALAREIVRKRQPVAVKKTRRPRISRATPAADPLDHAPIAPPPAVPHLPAAVEQTKARRRRAVAGTLSTPAVQQQSGPSDLALPGLGPSTVGD